MKTLVWLTAVSLLLVTHDLVGATTATELRERILAGLRDEAARSDNPAAQQLRLFLPRLDLAKDEELLNLSSFLEQLPQTSTTAKLQELVAAYSAALKSEQDEQLKKQREAFATVAKKAVRDCLEATKSSDLDASIKAIAAFTDRRKDERQPTTEASRLFEQARSVADLLRETQNMIAGVSNEIPENLLLRFDAVLTTLSEYGTMMPRSELLLKIQEMHDRLPGTSMRRSFRPPAKPDEKVLRRRLDEIKSLSEIPKILEELSAVNSSNASPELNMAKAELERLLKTYHDLQRGFAVDLQLDRFSNRYGPSGPADRFDHLRFELILLALPRVLGIPDERGPQAGESLLGYLTRIKADAVRDRDWVLLARVAGIAERLCMQGVASTADANALNEFLSGQNLEQARQYTLAVTAYQTALKSGSQLLPIEEIGRKLDAIRRDHPEDFEAGQQATVAQGMRSGAPFPAVTRGIEVKPRNAMNPSTGRPAAGSSILAVPPVSPSTSGKSPSPQ